MKLTVQGIFLMEIFIIPVIVGITTGVILLFLNKYVFRKITKKKRIDIVKEEIVKEEMKKDMMNFKDKIKEFKKASTYSKKEKIYNELKEIQAFAQDEIKVLMEIDLIRAEYALTQIKYNKPYKKAEEEIIDDWIPDVQLIPSESESKLSKVPIDMAQKLYEKSLPYIYFGVIKSIEEGLDIKINSKTSDTLKPIEAILLKMKDNSFLLRYKTLEKDASADEISQILLAVGHELGHIVLNHEFITQTYIRVSSVLLNKDRLYEAKEKNEKDEANVFSIALFCQYLRLFCPDFIFSRSAARHIYNLFKKYGISEKRIQEILDIFKTT